MAAEVIDTNVLHLATAHQEGWTRPDVPVDDETILKRIFEWLKAFRNDDQRLLVMDFPDRTILGEYKNKLDARHYGRLVVQAKFDRGAMLPVDLTYWDNGTERVADLPEEVLSYFHDLGDRKIVAAAWLAPAPIVNATDGDWTENAVAEGLRKLGIEVLQLLSDDERAALKNR